MSPSCIDSSSKKNRKESTESEAELFVETKSNDGRESMVRTSMQNSRMRDKKEDAREGSDLFEYSLQ